jgi:hypothetical protein
VVAALDKVVAPGMPTVSTECSVTLRMSAAAVLLVVGHVGSSAEELDALMPAKARADAPRTSSAATPVIAILFICDPEWTIAGLNNAGGARDVIAITKSAALEPAPLPRRAEAEADVRGARRRSHLQSS